MDNKGIAWIAGCRKRWMTYQLLARLLYAAAATLLTAAVWTFFGGMPPWVYPVVFTACFAVFIYLSGVARTDASRIAAMLDRQFPALEYSASLLLKPVDTLGVLQQLQVERLQRSVDTIHIGEFAHPRVFIKPAIAAVVAWCLYAAMAYVPLPLAAPAGATVTTVPATMPAIPLPASIAGAEVVISAPRYTGLAPVTQDHLEITAPVGSHIAFRLTTDRPVSGITARFDGKEEQAFTAAANDSLQWELTIEARKSGFFQLELDGEPSALYPLSVTPDLPIAIRVNTPDQHTVIDYGFPERVDLSAVLDDDYAIDNASIMATISTGKGEGVSFRSEEIPLNTPVKGRKTARVAQEIDLRELGMATGDELYFYLQAFDNAGQESRSDVFVVVLQDTAGLFSMTGMVAGVDLVPQYFRSQRQIIIDTEQLIAEMDSIPEATAQQRSNNLGIDQQLLRLRYGQFLGEEAEEGIGGHGGHEGHDHGGHQHGDSHDHHGHEDHDHAHEGGEERAEVPVDVEVLIAEMSHQHDRAEDATFFNAEQKASLRATLTEMWNTELRLRTHQPREALPYAYKALRLLKDLQQKSRVYVGKSATKTTPLDRGKRLSGDLAEVGAPVQPYQAREPSTGQQARRELQAALAYLSVLHSGRRLDEDGRLLLIKAEEQLMEAAIHEPGKYLQALQAIRTLEENGGTAGGPEAALVGKAIQELIPALEKQPERRPVAGNDDMYNRYFSEITPN